MGTCKEQVLLTAEPRLQPFVEIGCLRSAWTTGDLVSKMKRFNLRYSVTVAKPDRNGSQFSEK